MATPTPETAILGTTTDLLTGRSITVYYDPKSGKYYQNPIDSPLVYEEVTNSVIIGAYLSQFALQKQSLDKLYQEKLRQQDPNSTLDPDLKQLIEQANDNPTIPKTQETGDSQGAGNKVENEFLSSDLSNPNTNTTIGNPKDIISIPAKGIRYPLRIDENQDKIKFIACEIKKKTTLNGEPIYTPKNGPIFLAIQAPISDQNSVEWGPDNVNAIDAFVFKKAREGIFGNLTFPTPQEIKNQYSAYADRITTYLAGQAASVNNAVARTDRAILNPNLELLFQAPQLRPFSFQFKLTARERDEAIAIKKIIKYFKYHMAVRKENNNLFLRAPYVFTIQYLKGETPRHPGINLISPENNLKACALTNCSVDYTPLGTYMTNIDDPNQEANGTMVSYTLSLQFQEITPIYDTDYRDYPHPIGF